MPKTVEIDLTDQGFPDSVVRFKDARYMRRKKFEALATEMAEKVSSADIGQGDEFLRSRITDWNIFFTDEDNEKIELKNIATDDFADLPSPLYVFLWAKLAETFQVDIPKALRRD